MVDAEVSGHGLWATALLLKVVLIGDTIADEGKCTRVCWVVGESGYDSWRRVECAICQLAGEFGMVASLVFYGAT